MTSSYCSPLCQAMHYFLANGEQRTSKPRWSTPGLALKATNICKIVPITFASHAQLKNLQCHPEHVYLKVLPLPRSSPSPQNLLPGKCAQNTNASSEIFTWQASNSNNNTAQSSQSKAFKSRPIAGRNIGMVVKRQVHALVLSCNYFPFTDATPRYGSTQ